MFHFVLHYMCTFVYYILEFNKLIKYIKIKSTIQQPPPL